MVTAELMSHFVRHIVNIKPVTYRVGRPRDPLSFSCSIANNAKTCDPTASGTEDMTDVIGRAANYSITLCLILTQHRLPIVVSISIRLSRKNKQVGIGN